MISEETSLRLSHKGGEEREGGTSRDSVPGPGHEPQNIGLGERGD